MQLRDVDINCEWPGILYGLCKVHKAIIDICPPFRPILSAIGTPSYKLAKFLVPKLSSITFNEFTVKDYFASAEEIVHQDSKLSMGILDVDSLFTNIPLEDTINICTNLLYDNEDIIEGINKSGFKNLLSLATRRTAVMKVLENYQISTFSSQKSRVPFKKLEMSNPPTYNYTKKLTPPSVSFLFSDIFKESVCCFSV